MRLLTAIGTVLFLILNVTSSLAFAATKHGCAPFIPPTVPGTLVQPAATRGTLFINEVLLVPHSTWNCSELGTYSPGNDTWVEIYNAQNQPFDLYAVHASLDSGPNTNPFYLPFGSAIAPHGYLVIFPRTDASFLSTETSTLRLLIAGVPVDEGTIPSLAEDQSYARVPDGTNTWQILSTPTIGASNIIAQPTPTTASNSTDTSTSSRHTSHRSSSDKGSSGGHSRTDQGSSVGGSTDFGTSDSGGSSGTGQSKQVAGVQPTWSTLQLPNTTPVSSTPRTSNTRASSSPPPASDAMDTPHKILLTTLAVALALALLWCLRLFRT